MYYYEPIKIGNNSYHFYFHEDVFKFLSNKTRSEKTLRTLIAKEILKDQNVQQEISRICVVTLAYRKNSRKREGECTVSCGIGNYFNTNLDINFPINTDEIEEDKPTQLTNLPQEALFCGGVKVILDKNDETIQTAKTEIKKIVDNSQSIERFLPKIPISVNLPLAIDEKNYPGNIKELEKRFGLREDALDDAINDTNQVAKLSFSQSDQVIINSIAEKQKEIIQLVTSPSVQLDTDKEDIQTLSNESLNLVKTYTQEKTKKVEKEFSEFKEKLTQENKNNFIAYKNKYRNSVEEYLKQNKYGQGLVAIQYIKERIILALFKAAYDYLNNIAWKDQDREKKLNDFKKKFSKVCTIDIADGLVNCSSFEDFHQNLMQMDLMALQQFIINLRKACNTTTGWKSDATTIVNNHLNELLIDNDFQKPLIGLVKGPVFSFVTKTDFKFSDQLFKLEKNLPKDAAGTLSQLSQDAQAELATKKTKIDEEQQTQILASFNFQFESASKKIQAYRKALILNQEMAKIETQAKSALSELNKKIAEIKKNLKNLQKKLESLVNEFISDTDTQTLMRSEINKLISDLDKSAETSRTNFNTTYQLMFKAEGPIASFINNLDLLQKSNNHVNEYLERLKQIKKSAQVKLDSLTTTINSQNNFLTVTLHSYLTILEIPIQCSVLTQQCQIIANQSYAFKQNESFNKETIINLNDRFYADKSRQLSKAKIDIETKRDLFCNSFRGPLPKLANAVEANLNQQCKAIQKHQETIAENQRNDNTIFLCHMVVNILLDLEKWKRSFLSDRAQIKKNGEFSYISKNIFELLVIVKSHPDWQKDSAKAKTILNALKKQASKQDLSQLKNGSPELDFLKTLAKINLDSSESIRTTALTLSAKQYAPLDYSVLSPDDLNQIGLPKVALEEIAAPKIIPQPKVVVDKIAAPKIKKPFAESHPTLNKIWTNTKNFFGHPTTKKVLKGAAIVGGIVLLIAITGVVLYFAAPAVPAIASVVIPAIAFAEATIPPVVATTAAVSAVIGPEATAAAVIGGAGVSGAAVGGGLTTAWLGIKTAASKAWSGIKNCFGFGKKPADHFPEAELPKPQEPQENSPAASPSLPRQNSNAVIEDALKKSESGSIETTQPIFIVRPNNNKQEEFSPSPSPDHFFSPTSTPVSSPPKTPPSESPPNYNKNTHVFYGKGSPKNSTDNLLINALIKEVARLYADYYQKTDPQKPEQTFHRMDKLKNPIPAIQAIFKQANNNRQNNIEDKDTINRVEFILDCFDQLLKQETYKTLQSNPELNEIFPQIAVNQSFQPPKVA